MLLLFSSCAWVGWCKTLNTRFHMLPLLLSANSLNCVYNQSVLWQYLIRNNKRGLLVTYKWIRKTWWLLKHTFFPFMFPKTYFHLRTPCSCQRVFFKFHLAVKTWKNKDMWRSYGSIIRPVSEKQVTVPDGTSIQASLVLRNRIHL